MVTKHELLAHIHARIVEEGDCWRWTGHVVGESRTPVFLTREKHSKSIRRALLEAKFGELPHGLVAGLTCGTPDCVNPAHVVRRTRSAVMSAVNRRNAQRADVLARRTALNRSRAKLTADAVAEIRMSGDRQDVLAKRYGVSQSTISQVKTGATWRVAVGNPWQGLMR